VTGCDNDTQYWFDIRGVNDFCTGDTSVLGTVTTLLDCPDVPVLLAAVNHATDGFTIRWELSDGATSYEYGVWEVSLIGGHDIQVRAGTTESTFVVISGLESNTLYNFSARALNALCVSICSCVYADPKMEVSTLNVVPDQVKGAFASSITSDSFAANWPHLDNTTGYELLVATDDPLTDFVLPYNPDDVGYVKQESIYHLTEPTYYFQVRAYNDVGAGPWSEVIPVKMSTAEWRLLEVDGTLIKLNDNLLHK